MKSIAERIAAELDVKVTQIEAAVQLMDEGSTVPFIARYRKEVTGGLSDTHLRAIQERLPYLREMEERRQTVIETIREQGKLTPELQRELLAADSRTRIEDLYLPYRPKRRSKASVAIEAGLEPLAEQLLAQPQHLPEKLAAAFVDAGRGIETVVQALEGAKSILIERLAEDAEILGVLREMLWQQGGLRSQVVKNKEKDGSKFSDYFDYWEAIRLVPSHRVLAVFRGKSEEVLRLAIVHEKEKEGGDDGQGFAELVMARRQNIVDHGRPGDGWLMAMVREAWRKRIYPGLETDLFKRVLEKSHEEAIQVFGKNLKELLLAPPAGPVVVMGLDPGLRTGVKVAVVDHTGKILATTTIYPHAPQERVEESLVALASLVKRHNVGWISIGNGTASRETERLAAELIKKFATTVKSIVVSEAGASVYSASEYASAELPDLDVSLRGAVSIARRLQDPLAELVKIDPKAIGVGQYQHDLNEKRLAATLDAVVEDAVNAVGVDVNTASPPLLERVSGLNRTLAQNIVRFREQNGPFRQRKDLARVPRFGPKTYELAAGFLRIRHGDNPLDASAVHPESYPVVERIVRQTGLPLDQLMGKKEVLARLQAKSFIDEKFGEPTVRDILLELEKPGRDPRPELHTASFREGVETMKDLQPGMILEGVVTNVTNFGAFVDIGVHQDGLVHISMMADSFVKDPHVVTRVGAVVKVRVLEIEVERKRIALSMRLTDKPVERTTQPSGKNKMVASETPTQTAFAAALERARRK